MPEKPPPLPYSRPTRGFAATHPCTLIASAAATAALFAAVAGIFLLFLAAGSHHDGQDVIQLGTFLSHTALLISPIGLFLATLALLRREPPLLAILALLLNTLPALGALAVTALAANHLFR